MANADMTIKIKVGLQVEKTAARAALKVLEAYLNDNRQDEIIPRTRDDGTTAYSFLSDLRGDDND